MKPGFGSDVLHIGQTETEVMTVLGKPESRTKKHKGEFYYNYPKQGLELDFGSRGVAPEVHLCFRESVRGNRQAAVVTDVGLQPGDTRQRVLELMGNPEEGGAPRVPSSGIRFGEWFRYSAGINLQFGEDGCIDMITITSAGK